MDLKNTARGIKLDNIIDAIAVIVTKHNETFMPKGCSMHHG